MKFARYPGESARIIFAPVFIAIDRGYFAEEGLDVEVIEPHDHPWQSVARGESDAGVGYIDYCARPEFLGRFKAVAVQERLSPGHGLPALLARPDLIDSGKLDAGLRGRAIGLTWGRGDDYLTYYDVLRRDGLSLADVRLVPVPHEGDARRSALERKEIDVIIGRRPRQIAEEEAHGLLRRWKTGSDVFPDWQNRYILYSTDFMRRTPDAGRAFLRAHQRAVGDYLTATDPDAPQASFFEYLSRMSLETVDLLRNFLPAGFPADCRIEAESLGRDIDALKAVDLFPRHVGLGETVDMSFA
ncbi:MAG TPA: ABC transporter substrate-binding protein [Candidatus Binatia bacterium]|nr:ABC transporter substrate-binding protein [Candidatus Binatia bacterium]